jgi:hypothetical protein
MGSLFAGPWCPAPAFVPLDYGGRYSLGVTRMSRAQRRPLVVPFFGRRPVPRINVPDIRVTRSRQRHNNLGRRMAVGRRDCEPAELGFHRGPALGGSRARLGGKPGKHLLAYPPLVTGRAMEAWYHPSIA